MPPRRKRIGCTVWLWVLLAVGVTLAVSLMIESGSEVAEREVVVFAAVSLTEGLDAVAEAFEATHEGVRVVRVYGASSTLARQIDAGAEADVFLSADTAWVGWLARRGRTRGRLLSPLANALVIARPARTDDVVTPHSLASFGRVAIADPDHVPAGRYARLALEADGLWERVAERAVWTPDVRAALAAVTTGAVDAAVVYASDVLTSERVRAAYRWPGSVDVRYGAVRIADSARPRLADELWTFMWHPDQVPYWAAHGLRARNQPEPSVWNPPGPGGDSR